MRNFFKYRAYVFGVLLIALAIFSIGFYAGKSSQSENDKKVSILNKNVSVGESVDFAAFWKAWEIINEKYVSTSTSTPKKTDNQNRLYGAIEGMVRSLNDPYTIFFPPVESKSFSEEISGNFEGVGMEVGTKDDTLIVISPLKNTPAYRAGIKSGDKIVKINETLTNTLNTPEAIKIIKGPKGTKVKFTIVREGVKDPLIIEVVRDVINIPTIDSEIKDDVFIIHLYNFSAISSNSFRGELRKFIESGKYKMIIDLRGNPGGYLESAVDMASWFLPSGKIIVKEDFKDEKDTQIFRSKGYNIFNDKLKLVVLIDGGSASASEILAGALHEQGIATLVGTQSFGKGSVQELVEITPDTSLKVTIARWLTPKGTSISHGGLTPDVVVKFDEKEFLKGVDNQIEKAIEILNK
ncbi:MAG: S41 family peptidase [Candidatus Paceibacterota bacterium]|jgi:carboxyl-terminal processing protease